MNTSTEDAAAAGEIRRDLTIVNKRGLHARASARFVQLVGGAGVRFGCVERHLRAGQTECLEPAFQCAGRRLRPGVPSRDGYDALSDLLAVIRAPQLDREPRRRGDSYYLRVHSVTRHMIDEFAARIGRLDDHPQVQILLTNFDEPRAGSQIVLDARMFVAGQRDRSR